MSVPAEQIQAEEIQGIPSSGWLQSLRIAAKRGMLALLLVATLSSALAVIYAKHLSRGLYAELQALQQVRDELNVEWKRLLLEQTTWATPVRIEQIARTKLDMVTPPADTVMTIRP